MRKGKLWILLFTLLFLCAAVFAGRKEAQQRLTLSALVTAQGAQEELRCWESEWNTLYIFLPGYAELDQVQLKVARDNVFWINGQPVTDGMYCDGFALDEVYPLEITENAGVYAQKVVFLRSAGVSTLFVDVHSGNMTYIHEDKDHKESGSLRLYDPDGKLSYSGKADSLSGRGQSSWSKEKKSYNLRLTQDADLLGMGKAANWVLQANGVDISNLRNKIVYDFAAAAGLAYTPECRWVDLYLNGEYAGLYLLCEKVEVHPERVNISNNDSFLVVKDWEWRFEAEGDPYIMTGASTALGIRYADMPQTEVAQRLQSVENAILSENSVDPVTGKHLQDLIDMESWVRKYLLEEVFGNTDGQSLSQYYYLDGGSGDGKLFAGPAWDYDLAMRSEPDMFFINREDVYGSQWQPALFRKDAFYQRLRLEYTHVFRPLLQQLLEGGLDAYMQQIAVASDVNAQRWAFDGAEAYAELIRTFLTERVRLLDRIWLEGEESFTVQLYSFDGKVRSFIRLPGEALPELAEGENLRWYHEDLEHPVDITQPVTESMKLYQVYEKEPVSAGEEEPAPEETPEPMPFRRWGPAAALLVMLAGIIFAGIRQDRNNGKDNRRQKSSTVNQN